MVAQMTAGRNGQRIQSEPTMSPPMNNTASIVRVMSCARGDMFGLRLAGLHRRADQWGLAPFFVAPVPVLDLISANPPLFLEFRFYLLRN